MCLSKLRLALVALLASVAVRAPLVVANGRGLLDAGDNVDSTTAVLPQLALQVVATTPLELIASSPSTDAPIVDVEGSQPIQAIFSRPVIALGEDGSAPAQQPFQLSCNNYPSSGDGTQLQLGKFRWVTTFVARFDPDGEWPTDLDLDFSWNSNVTSWDGADLQEDNLQVRQACRLRVAANRHFASCGFAASAHLSLSLDQMQTDYAWKLYPHACAGSRFAHKLAVVDSFRCVLRWPPKTQQMVPGRHSGAALWKCLRMVRTACSHIGAHCAVLVSGWSELY